MSLRNLALMYLGAICGTAVLLSAYVSFAGSTPDPEFRHMALARFYFFIPFFALWAFSIGVLAEAFWFQRRAPHLRWSSAWAVLGVAYSLVWLPYGLGAFQFPYAIPISYLLAAAVAYIAHRVFGARRARAA